ncbi:hypothetical protein [Terrisporobacter mayombei]|uniref:Phage protein n=1 Tax=Terrisporobacter mayombei TaxID=1541 RepID=A0ABY9Q0A8_9FIRM|nr:hypothetical protein [Terrisporobacter mayombei]MCC3868467.1 hypothetical protein [Terrisporobacter mayombei]WMT80621.1 hypothetical protein TEMA_09420 [Terrisporobacter mayombei]
MRRFKAKVTIEKEFVIEIDENIATEEELTNWESVFWNLDSEDTKIASYVSSYCELRATQGIDLEGFGIVLPIGETSHRGIHNNVICNHMRTIKADDDGYTDVYLQELKGE